MVTDPDTRAQLAALYKKALLEILEQHHDFEAVRARLGHTRIDTTQTYARIRPAGLKRAVEFYERKAVDLLAN